MALSSNNVGKQVIYNKTDENMYIAGIIVSYYKNDDTNEEYYMVSIGPSREVIRVDNDTDLIIVN